MRSKSFSACVVVISSSILAGLTHAEIVTLAPSQDNTLFQNSAGFLSNGSGEYMFVGRTAARGGSALRRGLIQFDLSVIPAGSMITGATLTMNVNWFRGGAINIGLHPLLASWGEGVSNAGGGESGGGGGGAASEPNDATWISRFQGGAAWTTAGGDFNATASATRSVSGTGFYSWSSAGMVANLQTWLSNPQQNSGWMMKAPETSVGNAKRFASRENADPSLRPNLVVTYLIPTPSATIALAGMGLVGAVRRRR